jgi:hypothetical protein|tara:strand:+ start:246 stop:359 length:114 start_codon:yes stop_codon:yes gene_type:complete
MLKPFQKKFVPRRSFSILTTVTVTAIAIATVTTIAIG